MEGAKSVRSVAEAAATTAEQRSRFRRICVFCGSQCGKKPSYQELGKELVNSGIDLVYGGRIIGLMGLVSHAVHDGGRHVLGWLWDTGGARGGDYMGSTWHSQKADRANKEYIPKYESQLVWDTAEHKPLSFVPEPESGIAS